MRRYLPEIGIAFIASLVLLGIFGIYHHSTITNLKEQQQQLYDQLSQQLQQQAASTSNQISDLNSSVGQRMESLETKSELQNLQRKRELFVLEKDLNSTKKTVQSQLNFLSEEVVSVREENSNSIVVEPPFSLKLFVNGSCTLDLSFCPVENLRRGCRRRKIIRPNSIDGTHYAGSCPCKRTLYLAVIPN